MAGTHQRKQQQLQMLCRERINGSKRKLLTHFNRKWTVTESRNINFTINESNIKSYIGTHMFDVKSEKVPAKSEKKPKEAGRGPRQFLHIFWSDYKEMLSNKQMIVMTGSHSKNT
jgi:hypothetical protein